MVHSILDDDLTNCPNAILAGFLRDWWEEAREMNAKSASGYKRAYESMKAYPIKFDHPLEAVILNGIKDKIASRLADQYDKYCIGMGIPKPQHPRRSMATTANQRPVDAAPTEPIDMARRNRKRKEVYIPRQNTGAYALLRALYEAFSQRERLTKEQLKLRAAPYSNSSFEAPSNPGSHYTAWNAMKKLEQEGLVSVSGHPKKYEISDDGIDLWEKIERAERGGLSREENNDSDKGSGTSGIERREQSLPAPPVQRAPLKRKKPTEVFLLDENDDADNEPVPPPPRRRRVSPSNNNRESTYTHRLDSQFGVVQGLSDSDQTLPTREQLRTQRATLRQKYANMPREYEATGQCTQGNSIHMTNNNDSSAIPGGRLELDAKRMQQHGTGGPGNQTVGGTSNTNSEAPRSTISRASISTSNITRTDTVPSLGFTGTSIAAPSRTTNIGHNLVSAGSTSHLRDQSAVPGHTTEFPSFTPECLRAGTYSIELILDNREVRAKHDRDYLQNNLSDHGVVPDTRALQVGDALWIAKENSGLQRELVLDYIVERKRLDDLIGSIKDGRFHEQKFRLEKSKIRNVIFIVEDIPLRDNEQQMQEALDTAIASTMVCDGFFVKRTRKLDDTIRYLVHMTSILKELYQDKDLYITPPGLIDSRTYPALLSHLSSTYSTKSFHLQYSIFSELVHKSGSQTLRDVFLKLLLCTRGLSIEKAVSIQRVFPTPSVLTAAYRSCVTQRERDDLLVDRCDPMLVGRRKIGKALSKKVADVWWGRYGNIPEALEG